MSARKKLTQLSFGDHILKMKTESAHAKNLYIRPRNNMGQLHRRHK